MKESSIKRVESESNANSEFDANKHRNFVVGALGYAGVGMVKQMKIDTSLKSTPFSDNRTSTLQLQKLEDRVNGSAKLKSQFGDFFVGNLPIQRMDVGPGQAEEEEEEEEEDPIETLADNIFDGAGGYVCGSNMREAGSEEYGNGPVCSDRFDACRDYFNQLAEDQRQGIGYWSISANNDEVNHVAFVIGPANFDQDSSWVVDPWLGVTCTLNSYEGNFENNLDGSTIMVGAVEYTAEQFAARLAGNWQVNAVEEEEEEQQDGDEDWEP